MKHIVSHPAPARLLLLAATLSMAQPAAAEGPYAEAAVQTFIASDADGNEKLDFDEFRTFIQTMAEMGQPTSRRIRTFGVYRMAFNRIDTNGDGLATPDEMRAADAENAANPE